MTCECLRLIIVACTFLLRLLTKTFLTIFSGGMTLTISGYGFKQDADVTINSAECKVMSVMADEITCTVPHSVSIHSAA